MAGSRGYKYFGAAKDLPGVRELFQQAAELDESAAQGKNRAELVRRVDAHYYGYMDEEDGLPAGEGEGKSHPKIVLI